MSRRALATIVGALIAVAAVFYAACARQQADTAWRLWCTAQQFPSGYLVHEGRLKSGVLTPGGWSLQRREAYADGDAVRLRDLDSQTETVETHEALWLLDPKAKTALKTPVAGRQSPQAGRGYRFGLGGTRTIAGRPASEIVVTDARTARVAQRLFVWMPCYVPLRTEQYDADGDLVAWSEYRTLEAGSHLSRPLKLPPPGWKVETVQADASRGPLSEQALVQACGFSPVPPAYVPPGYRGPELYGFRCEGGRIFAELRYRDPLRSWSLYERPVGHGRGRGGGQGRGMGRGPGGGHGWPDEPRVTDRGVYKTARVRRGDLHIAFSGDLTDADIQRVLESVPAENLEYIGTPDVLGSRETSPRQGEKSDEAQHNEHAVGGPGSGGPPNGAGPGAGPGVVRGPGHGPGRGMGRGRRWRGGRRPGLDPVGQASD